MDKTFSYIPDSVLRFTVNADRHIRIRSSKDPASGMDPKLPVAEPYARLIGRWIIECTKNTILMRETPSRAESDYIELSFPLPETGVEAEYSGRGGRVTSKFENVGRICVYPREVGEVRVQSAGSARPSPGAEDIPARIIPKPASPAEKQPEPADASLIRQLKEALAREQAYTKSLQEIIEKRLDDALQMLDREKKALTSENRAKQEELVSLDAEIEKLKRDIRETPAKIQSKKDELAVLQKQSQELDVQREAIELDCDKAKEQTEELKARVRMDRETAALLEEGDRLKRGTISKTLEEMDSEIEKVEKRIAFILKFRLKFNQIVEDTILGGDGTISAGEEAGGIADGIGSSTPGENT